MSINAVANGGGIRVSFRIASAMGNIIAVVAVFDTQSEMSAVAVPKATSNRDGLVPTRRIIPNAIRRFRP